MEGKDPRIKAFTVFIKSSQSVQKLIKQDFLKKEINLSEYAVMELLYHRGDQPIQSIGRRVLMGGCSIIYGIHKLEETRYQCTKPLPECPRKMFDCMTHAGSEYINTRVEEQAALINTI